MIIFGALLAYGGTTIKGIGIALLIAGIALFAFGVFTFAKASGLKTVEDILKTPELVFEKEPEEDEE